MTKPRALCQVCGAALAKSRGCCIPCYKAVRRRVATGRDWEAALADYRDVYARGLRGQRDALRAAMERALQK